MIPESVKTHAAAVAPTYRLFETPTGFEVIWRRRYKHLQSICLAWAPTAMEALEKMIAEEEYRLLLLEHGETCACEECCVARVDRTRK